MSRQARVKIELGGYTISTDTAMWNWVGWHYGCGCCQNKSLAMLNDLAGQLQDKLEQEGIKRKSLALW